MITFWPINSPHLGLTMRAMTSRLPPGGTGTTSRTGRTGKSFVCAHAGEQRVHPSITTKLARPDLMNSSCDPSSVNYCRASTWAAISLRVATHTSGVRAAISMMRS